MGLVYIACWVFIKVFQRAKPGFKLFEVVVGLHSAPVTVLACKEVAQLMWLCVLIDTPLTASLFKCKRCVQVSPFPCMMEAHLALLSWCVASQTLALRTATALCLERITWRYTVQQVRLLVGWRAAVALVCWCVAAGLEQSMAQLTTTQLISYKHTQDALATTKVVYSLFEAVTGVIETHVAWMFSSVC